MIEASEIPAPEIQAAQMKTPEVSISQPMIEASEIPALDMKTLTD